MQQTGDTHKPIRSSMLVRGESAIASAGIILATIMLVTMSGASWWTLQAQRDSLEAARKEQVRAVSKLVWQSAEVMLARNELTAVRRLVADAGRDYDLAFCRIVLPSGEVVAAKEPSQITAHKLPETWSDQPMPLQTNAATSNVIMVSKQMLVPGRGTARLDIQAPIEFPIATFLEAQTGVGAIGAAGLVATLIVYRSMRSRLRAMGAIRESLLAMGRGEAQPAVLAVSPELGPEASQWNDLLDERASLRKQMVIDKAREGVSSRRENRGDLDAAFDAMSHGLILIGEKLAVKYCNGAAAVFLQAKRDEMIGADITKFLKNENVRKAVVTVATSATRRRMTVEVTRGGEGGSGVLKFSVRPVRREDCASAMIVIEDVTQQRVADEARNAFVAQATHELRTPLTNIRLYVETAIDEGSTDPTVRAKCLNVINQEARRLEGIVTEMLSVAEIEAGSFKLRKGDVRLDALFGELAADFDAQAADKELKLKFNLPPKFPVMKGDRDKIAIALHNLIGNALKYTPKSGSIMVNVDADAKQLTVEVVDTGIGIGDEDQKRIFEKFFRAKDPRVGRITGTGLGLTLAREVMRLHGGDITVQSQLNKGSTFTLLLPLSGEAA